MVDLSMSKSRIVSTNSMKKTEQSLPVPSVSLEMEMKALKFLREKNLFNPLAPEMADLTLFEEPTRTGTLLNIIVKE